jgi:uncharacterized NAD(P)/FAD-binding protein YdhS
MAPPRTVVIAGAGFSGVVTAAQLLRRSPGLVLRVVLVNRSGAMARGVAYGTNSPAHVLNVPAGRMGACPDDPEGFLRFACERDASITAGSFVPRSLYGDYLEWFLADAERAAGHGVRLDRIVGEVTSVEPDADGAGARVTVSDGSRFHADRVVLALGNYPPEDPPVPDESFYRSPLYVRDPWARGALDAAGSLRSALLIGTGLTMLDIALDLSGRGMRGPIVAVSRHGLLPQPHRLLAPATARHRPPGLQDDRATATTYLRSVREHARRLAKEGEDWRPVIDSLRPLTPTLWHALCPLERARFLRHVRPYWETHRHRAAPVAAAALRRLIDDGQLRILAGRVQGYETFTDSARVAVRPRGGDKVEHFIVDRVINCTGPSGDLRTLRDPLIGFLRSREMLRPDELGLGLETADDGALRDARGVPSGVIYYVGPLLKAMHWESTAVPELRVHAARLAATLACSLAG